MKRLRFLLMLDSFVVFLFAVGLAVERLSPLPWVPIVWAVLLVLNVVALRKANDQVQGSLSPFKRWMGIIVGTLLFLACISTIARALWGLGSGGFNVVDAIQCVGAALFGACVVFGLRGLLRV